MINVYYSPSGIRSTTGVLFERALEGYDFNDVYPDYSHVLYLATSSTKVREAQRIFHKLVTTNLTLQRKSDDSDDSSSIASRLSPVSPHCYIPPEMATIEQFSRKRYSLYGNRRIVQRSLIPLVISRLSGKGIGFSSLLADFISDLKRYYPDTGIDGIKDIFIDIFHELNIPEAVVKPALDCIDMFNSYNLFLEENGFVDGNDIINAFHEYISQMPHITLIIDGFYDPPPNEKNVLRYLIQNSGKTLIAVPYDLCFSGLSDGFINFLKENFNIKDIQPVQPAISRVSGSRPSTEGCLVYHSYPDPEGEVEGIARNIKSLYLSGRFKRLEEIAVAFPDLNRYSSIIERVFRRYGIPFDISNKRPLAKTRPFFDLISMLNSVAEDYPRLKFSQFLSSNYFRNMPEPLKTQIPKLSLQSGIISGKESWLNLASKGSETIDIKGTAIENGLNFVFEKLKPLEDIKYSAALETYMSIFKKVLDELGFLEAIRLPSEPIGESESPDVVRDEKKVFDKVLEQVSFLETLYHGNITLVEFIEILCHLLNASFIEEEWQGVRVMELFDVMGLSPEYLYIGGLTDEAMPVRQEIDYILPDNAKRRSGLLYLDKYLDIQRFMFTCIVNSSRDAHLSYPLMEGENMYLPSSYLYPGDEIKGRIAGMFSKEEYLITNSKIPFSAHISEIQLQSPALSLQQYLKVTDIDAYRMCPRRFFIERLLELKPSDIKEYELEAKTIGNIMHKIMEHIIKEPIEDLDYLKNRAAGIIDEIVSVHKIEDYWKQLIRDTFIKILPDICEKEMEIRKEGYSTSEAEKSVSGEPINGIKLRGKIDRLDKIGDSIQIIDYKTGTAALNCAQVLKGNENLQLFLYASILKSHGYRVERVGIYSLKDIAVKWCPPKKRVKSKEAGGNDNSLDDYIIASLKFLEDAVNGIKKGVFTAQPLNEYNCRNCHELSFCPYIQQYE